MTDEQEEGPLEAQKVVGGERRWVEGGPKGTMSAKGEDSRPEPE